MATTALLAGAASASAQADSRAVKEPAPPPGNPYGGVPGGGLTLPPYYRPTSSVANANVYFPGTEELSPNEMRISFIGSAPGQAVSKDQACTCILVELGNGKRFFFDFGPGCMRNVVAMRIPIQLVNDIFFTHLHVDHYGDPPVPLRLRALDGAVEAAAGSWALRPHAQRRHEVHDRAHEGNDALAHRQLQQRADR